MDGGTIPGVRVALRDGGELWVSAEGVRIGERRFELGRIQDARQVSPDPETIALRVAGSPLLEFRPAQQGDGRLALEAIYRWRPDLRPVGFEAPETLPAGFPPLPIRQAPPMLPQQYAGYPPAAPGYPPPLNPASPGQQPWYPGYARPGFPSPQGAYLPYPGAPNPNRLTGEVTPYPRRFGEVLGATFQLFGKYLRQWLALGLLVGVVPGAITGALLLVMDDAQPSSTDLASTGVNGCQLPTFSFPPADQLVRDGVAFVGLLALAAIFSALAVAVLGFAAGEALLGRRVRVGESFAGGIRRLPSALGAVSLLIVITCLLLGPGLVSYVSALPSVNGLNLCAQTPDLSDHAVTGLTLLFVGGGLLLVGSIALLFLSFRLGAAPYVAATERVGTGKALARSWRLTRGFYWRTLGLFITLWILMFLLGGVIGLLTFAIGDPVESLLVLPLGQIIAAPLFALMWTTHIFDLRLRREGYVALRGEDASRSDQPDGASQPNG